MSLKSIVVLLGVLLGGSAWGEIPYYFLSTEYQVPPLAPPPIVWWVAEPSSSFYEEYFRVTRQSYGEKAWLAMKPERSYFRPVFSSPFSSPSSRLFLLRSAP